MKKFLSSGFVTSIILIILGIILIAQPDAAMSVATAIIGCGLLIVGAIGLIVLLVKNRSGEKKSDADQAVLSGSVNKYVVLIICGAVMLTNKTTIVSILPFLIGVMLMINGSVNAVSAFIGRKQTGKWAVAMILGLITLLIGVLIVRSPLETALSQIVILGISLVIDGVSNLVSAIISKKN